MVKSLDDVFRLIERLQQDVTGGGISLDNAGFPQLPNEAFLAEVPDDMIDWLHRHQACDPSRTVVNFFMGDREVYRRLERLGDDMPEYRRFMGVVAPDVTVTTDMDQEFQRAIMLLNQLGMARVAVGGIKVVPNLRNGSPETISCLSSIPLGVIWASSSLGCHPLRSNADYRFLCKVMHVRPSFALLYGKPDHRVERQLDSMGYRWRRYESAGTRRRGRRRR